MIRRGKRGVQAPVPMIERWAAAHDAGQVWLDPFTPEELASVALDPDYLPADVRGPALQAVTPLLAELAAGQDGLILAVEAVSLVRVCHRPGFEVDVV